MCCTRVIENEGSPIWDETNMVLVGPQEIDAEEDVMLQIWDSGKFWFLIPTLVIVFAELI